MFLPVDMAVALQLRVLQAAIELIRTTANRDAQEQAGVAPSLSAAHRAMFQKRKGIAGEQQKSILVLLPLFITSEMSILNSNFDNRTSESCSKIYIDLLALFINICFGTEKPVPILSLFLCYKGRMGY